MYRCSYIQFLEILKILRPGCSYIQIFQDHFCYYYNCQIGVLDYRLLINQLKMMVKVPRRLENERENFLGRLRRPQSTTNTPFLSNYLRLVPGRSYIQILEILKILRPGRSYMKPSPTKSRYLQKSAKIIDFFRLPSAYLCRLENRDFQTPETDSTDS